MSRIGDLAILLMACALLLAAMERSLGERADALIIPAVQQPSLPSDSKQDEPARKDRRSPDRSSRHDHSSTASIAHSEKTAPAEENIHSAPQRGRTPVEFLPAPELTPELIQSSFIVAADIDERLAHQLRRLHEINPDAFMDKLKHSRRLLDLARVRQRDPFLYQLKLRELEIDAKVKELVARLRKARENGPKAEAAAIEEELRLQVRLQIITELHTREDYLCRLRELADQVDQQLQHDRRNFNDLVEKRVQSYAEGGGDDPNPGEHDRPAAASERSRNGDPKVRPTGDP